MFAIPSSTTICSSQTGYRQSEKKNPSMNINTPMKNIIDVTIQTFQRITVLCRANNKNDYSYNKNGRDQRSHRNKVVINGNPQEDPKFSTVHETVNKDMQTIRDPRGLLLFLLSSSLNISPPPTSFLPPSSPFPFKSLSSCQSSPVVDQLPCSSLVLEVRIPYSKIPTPIILSLYMYIYIVCIVYWYMKVLKIKIHQNR